MRINHNIAALNTYNKLTANTAATSKSLEKLSSGLKINKAGDNAAGLAISEKMRGQIRGLDQASTNASDAISMINTAEGALSETHSILQRMRELAVQSSNDTNVTIDRDEIQKEMNQLTSEINRIGNTTEFNTQKLLDGGGSKLTELNVNTTTMGGDAGAISNVVTKQNSATGKATTSLNFTATAGNLTMTFQSDELGEDLNGYTFSIVSGAASGVVMTGAKAVQITVTDSLSGYTAADLTNLLQTTGVVAQDITVTVTDSGGAEVAGALLGAASGTRSLSAMTGGAEAGTRGVYEFDVTEAFANTDTFTIRVQSSGIPERFNDVTLTAGATTTDTAADAATFAYGSVSDRKTSEEQAQEIATALNLMSGVSTYYTASAEGSTVRLVEKDTTISGTNVTKISQTSTAVSGVMTYSGTTTNLVEAGGKYTIDGVDIFVVASGADTSSYESNTFITFNSGETISGQLTDLANVINANNDLNSRYGAASDAGGTLTLTQTAGNRSREEAVITTSDVSDDGFEANFQIGANTAQSMTVEINDMRSVALGIAGKSAGGSIISEDATVTASYTSAQEVTNGTTNSGTEYALDVSTHQKATAAITIINDAIQSVSAERSKLGSYQNRLEHTINNLGTSSENLTTAESRIRDVDMAKEMMEFTKNNILSQAAQSMLAQANQQPQGVLQLLQ